MPLKAVRTDPIETGKSPCCLSPGVELPQCGRPPVDRQQGVRIDLSAVLPTDHFPSWTVSQGSRPVRLHGDTAYEWSCWSSPTPVLTSLDRAVWNGKDSDRNGRSEGFTNRGIRVMTSGAGT